RGLTSVFFPDLCAYGIQPVIKFSVMQEAGFESGRDCLVLLHGAGQLAGGSLAFRGESPESLLAPFDGLRKLSFELPPPFELGGVLVQVVLQLVERSFGFLILFDSGEG